MIARAQLDGRSEATPAPRDLGEPAYLVGPVPGVDVVAQLIDRLLDYRAEVVDVREAADPRAAISAAVTAAVVDGRSAARVVVDPGLPADVRPVGVEVVEDRGLSVAELDMVDASVTSSAAAVASTGTILLDHTSGQGRRAISLVPDLHVCLVAERDVHAELPGAIRALGPRRLMTWISGPSATSDIELVRVEGVHGPRHLVVVLHR
jgi:L-lactate dehydrogenase complex protein LldG